MEVYESPDVPALPPDHPPPEYTAAPSSFVTGNLRTQAARARFARSDVTPPQAPDFAAVRPRGYTVRNAKESRQERIARLQREIAELRDDGTDSTDDVAASAQRPLERQLEQMSKDLDALSAFPGTQVSATTAVQTDRDTGTAEDDSQAEDDVVEGLARVAKTVEGAKRIAQMEERLAGIERSLAPVIDDGWLGLRVGSDGGEGLAHRVTQLLQKTAWLAELDDQALAKRLASLKELAAASAAVATKNAGNPAYSQNTTNDVDGGHDGVIAKRLANLHAVHAQAADVATRLEAIEQASREQDREIKVWQQALDLLNGKVDDAANTMAGNLQLFKTAIEQDQANHQEKLAHGDVRPYR
ncbi:hypothetical protein PYCC9005_002925 [Savitreella phatthalungensis]